MTRPLGISASANNESDEDLHLIFSRFGKILSCEVIRDKRTGDSLQYAFIEFENQKDCEQAYFKMQGVLIDDHRIHVDFSQSVSLPDSSTPSQPLFANSHRYPNCRRAGAMPPSRNAVVSAEDLVVLILWNKNANTARLTTHANAMMTMQWSLTRDGGHRLEGNARVVVPQEVPQEAPAETEGSAAARDEIHTGVGIAIDRTVAVPHGTGTRIAAGTPTATDDGMVARIGTEADDVVRDRPGHEEEKSACSGPVHSTYVAVPVAVPVPVL